MIIHHLQETGVQERVLSTAGYSLLPSTGLIISSPVLYGWTPSLCCITGANTISPLIVIVNNLPVVICYLAVSCPSTGLTLLLVY